MKKTTVCLCILSVLSLSFQLPLLPVLPKISRKVKPTKEAADPAAKAKALQSKLTAAVNKLNAFEKKLKAKDGALLENKTAKEAEFGRLLKSAQTLAGQTGKPLTYTKTWASVSGSVQWVSGVTAYNAQLKKVADGVIGKSLSDALKKKAQKSVETLSKKITALKGTPYTTWAAIEPTIKAPNTSAEAARGAYAKALKIKTHLSTKTVKQVDADKLKGTYARNRTKALAAKPSPFNSQELAALVDASLLTIKIGEPKLDALKAKMGIKPKSAEEQQLAALVKELNSINSVLKQGVTSAEQTTQTAKFNTKLNQATTLKAKTKSTTKLPTMATPKPVSATKAAEKYLAAIEKIDKQLTSTGRFTTPTEQKRLSLIAQRTSLEKKAKALDTSVKIPPAPAEGTIAGGKTPKPAGDKADGKDKDKTDSKDGTKPTDKDKKDDAPSQPMLGGSGASGDNDSPRGTITNNNNNNNNGNSSSSTTMGGNQGQSMSGGQHTPTGMPATNLNSSNIAVNNITINNHGPSGGGQSQGNFGGGQNQQGYRSSGAVPTDASGKPLPVIKDANGNIVGYKQKTGMFSSQTVDENGAQIIQQKPRDGNSPGLASQMLMGSPGGMMAGGMMGQQGYGMGAPMMGQPYGMGMGAPMMGGYPAPAQAPVVVNVNGAAGAAPAAGGYGGAYGAAPGGLSPVAAGNTVAAPALPTANDFADYSSISAPAVNTSLAKASDSPVDMFAAQAMPAGKSSDAAASPDVIAAWQTATTNGK